MEQLKLKNNRNIILGAIVTLFLLGCKKVREENYYFPKDFVGNIAVIYSNTAKSNNQNEVYNYVIPEDGILNTVYSFKEGDFRINYYQKNNVNGYDTLFEELPNIKVDSTKNRIFFNRVLTFKKEGSQEIFVSTFYLGKTKSSDLEKNRFLFERKLEQIIFGQ